MRRKALLFRLPAQRFSQWRAETGGVVIVAGMLAALAAATLIYTFILPPLRNTLDKNIVRGCLKQANDLHDTLKDQGPNTAVNPSVLSDFNKCASQAINVINHDLSVASTEKAAQLQDLIKKINELTACNITQPQEIEATVGQSKSYQVVVRISLVGKDTTATINSTTRESGNLTPDTVPRGVKWSGDIDLSGKDVEAGSTSQLSVTVNNPPDPPTTCTNKVTVKWKAPPPPKILSFIASPQKVKRGQPSQLKWSVQDAADVEIDPGTIILDANGELGKPVIGGPYPVTPTETTSYTLTAVNPGAGQDVRSVTVEVLPEPKITSFSANPDEIAPGQSSTLSWTITDATSASIDQGVPGPFDPKSGSTTVSPDKDTTYTLTATGPGGDADPRSVTVRVESKPKTYTITLESSGGGNLATTDQVTVDGTISPTPPAGTTESVSIGVNGSPVLTVPVASDGSFVAVVPLQNKTTLDDLALFNDDVLVTTCGGASSPVDLWNTASPEAVKNFIEAAVVAPGGGTASNTASVVFYHGVQVIDAKVAWGGECPGPFKDFGGGAVLGPGDLKTVAYADCGVPCNKVGPDGVNCTADANATVVTTVGKLSASGFWTVDIPPP